MTKNLAGTDFIQNTVGVGKWIGQKVAGTQLGGFVGNMGQKAMGFGQGLLGGAKNIAGTAIGGVKNLAGRAASTKAGPLLTGCLIMMSILFLFELSQNRYNTPYPMKNTKSF